MIISHGLSGEDRTLEVAIVDRTIFTPETAALKLDYAERAQEVATSSRSRAATLPPVREDPT